MWPAFYAEMFSTRVRLSGMAIGTQVGFAIGGFAPTIATGLAGGTPADWWPVALFAGGLCAVSAIAASTARETHRVPMHELGAKPARRKSSAAPA